MSVISLFYFESFYNLQMQVILVLLYFNNSLYCIQYRRKYQNLEFLLRILIVSHTTTQEW